MKSENKKVVALAGGATGGHIFPLVAVAKSLREKDENVEIEYYGSGDELEVKLARENGIIYHKISCGRLRRYISFRSIFSNIADLFRFIAGFFQVLFAFSARKPTLIFSKGGFVALPVVLAGFLYRVPIIAHESDTTMGLANRISYFLCRRLGVAFPLDAYSELVQEKAFYCGVPLREEFISNESSPAGKYLLVIGGSSGAVSLNSLVFQVAPALLRHAPIIHITGKVDFERSEDFKKRLPLALQKRYKLIDFSDDIARLITHSKAVISRAGATAIFEIAAFNKPALFVPIPKEVTKHQILNSLYLFQKGYADVYFHHQSDTVFERKAINLLKGERDYKIRELFFPRSADCVAQVILDEIKRIEFSKIKKIFLIGIAGISMKSLAVVLRSLSKKVYGSDLKLGGHNPNNIFKELDLVAYSSAAGRDSAARAEHEEAEKLAIMTVKRSQLIGTLMRGKVGISVAGMHGKTTIASLIARIFETSYHGTSYLVGADSSANNPTAKIGSGKYFIVEACEYDDSFLDFPTTIAVVANIEREHLDYFKGGLEQIKKHFSDFISRIYPGGVLVYSADDLNTFSVIRDKADELERMNVKLVSYGFKPTADFSISAYKVEDKLTSFEIKHASQSYLFESRRFSGKHFAANVAAAFAVATVSNVDPLASQLVVSGFRGALRRFTKMGEKNKVVVYDDYGHHPTELKAVFSSLVELYPKNRKIAVFQPHQQGRFNQFFREFESAFGKSKLDVVGLLPVYKVAGRDEKEKYSSRDLVLKLKKEGVNCYYLKDYNEAVQFLNGITGRGDVVLTVGATDVWKVAEEYLKG
ncbi:MAG: glycosyltransferase [Candidatus Berkelbacteria bacterium]|nr:glycosyltransferase [Candidatus Berkelbacteria bacterium]